MMKKVILFLFVAMMATTTLSAQDYNWGLGFRGGATATGITVKGAISGSSALEGIVCLVHGVNIYGLYERYIPTNTPGLSLYYGGGANFGSWKKHGKNKFTVGADAVAGIEYKIPEVPVAIGADYKPTLNFAGHTGFKWYDFGVHVRVVF